MEKKRFFGNIGAIILFGILGTIISVVMITLFASLLEKANIYKDFQGEIVEFTLREKLILGAALSATDEVCAISLVQEDKTPLLYSLILGESIVNDAVSILIFESLSRVSFSTLSTKKVFEYLGGFLYTSFGSVVLGILFGALSAYLTKKLQTLKGDASNEIALLFYIAWTGYVLAELLGLSGVITILLCSAIMEYYSEYNLDSISQEATTDTFKFLGNAGEAFAFAYLGLSTFSYDLSLMSFYYIGVMTLIVLVSRFIGIIGLALAYKLLAPSSFRIPMKKVIVLWFGGSVRGAISFGLIVTVDTNESENLKLTVLGIVFLTTVIFGGVLPLLLKIFGLGKDTRHRPEISLPLLDESRVSQDSESFFERAWHNIDDRYLKPILADMTSDKYIRGTRNSEFFSRVQQPTSRPKSA